MRGLHVVDVLQGEGGHEWQERHERQAEVEVRRVHVRLGLNVHELARRELERAGERGADGTGRTGQTLLVRALRALLVRRACGGRAGMHGRACRVEYIRACAIWYSDSFSEWKRCTGRRGIFRKKI